MLDRPDLSRKLIPILYPHKLPTVLAPDEVARMLAATTCLKHRTALPSPLEGSAYPPPAVSQARLGKSAAAPERPAAAPVEQSAVLHEQ